MYAKFSIVVRGDISFLFQEFLSSQLLCCALASRKKFYILVVDTAPGIIEYISVDQFYLLGSRTVNFE